MYRCTDCRTAFVHPVPSPEALTAFYAAYHLSDASGGWYDRIEDRMRADFPAKLRLVQRALGNSHGRLLDVGCGKGFFAKAAADAGFEACGIDLSESGVRYARETLGVKAVQGLIEDQADSLGLFDAATFWATIEHLPDPCGTLGAIGRVLRPGGVLLLDTGMGDDWLDRTLPGRVQWYDPPQHLYVFSLEGMRRALAKAGFEVAAIDGSFERTPARRVIKAARNSFTAAALRVAATLGRVSNDPFTFTRFPMGNLMSVTARKAAARSNPGSA